MNLPIIPSLVIVLIIASVVGVAIGLTGAGERRRRLGLRLMQGGLSLAGLLMILSAVLGPDRSDVFYGLLLLAFGTGVTAIGRRKAGGSN
jgi:hypothetical protein